MTEILDACCGGRCWWWDKAHPLAVYMDIRRDLNATPNNPNWRCDPDIIGDFRAMPFDDESFQLVLFDPPHVVRDKALGEVTVRYGVLPRSSEQDDLAAGFSECWRVLAPGGALVFKWAGPIDRVQPHFPARPIVGTRSPRNGQTRWIVFYKPLEAEAA